MSKQTEGYLVRVLYNTDPQRKRAEHVIETTKGSRKTKGLTAIMPEDGVRKILERISPDQVEIYELGKSVKPDNFFDYKTDEIKLPQGLDEKILNYILRSSKIRRENNFLRVKRGAAEITELNLSADTPYINLRYDSRGTSAKIAGRLRTAIGIYTDSMKL